MAEGADCGAINAAKKRATAGRKSRPSQPKKSCGGRVSLDKVLGISTASGSGLTSDPKSGLIAYPAGCVIVLLHPKKNKQSHIINTSRKPFSAVAFSHDGKYLATGESGHVPCVRVWEVDGGQVAEVQSHKYGVSCVAFSTNSGYIVSVGYQHDMTVSVWDWRKGSVIASNKVSSRVFAVSFSQDSSYFVTAGNRHVKFWYLDASKERRVNSTVPLIGRSGLLGDHKNSIFSGVACGRGLMAGSTYAITSSGLLCLFNSSRQLEAWVNLKTSSASCLAVSENFVFCGCADGVVRVFGPSNLQYVTTLQRPHRLGVDVSQASQHSPLPASPGARYPDTLALTFDPAAKQLTCVYNDHSVYVWDVHNVKAAAKLYSALYHSSAVWSVEVYPELPEESQVCLPPLSFFTCSSDNTIRLWHTDAPSGHTNLYSNDLLRILYVGEDTQHLQAEGAEPTAGADGKAGIRVLGISPDGQHLAAGDRCGNLRIFGLEFLDELVKIEAHDSEVLCLAFSPASTGVRLLASGSRDRLIHIFNLDQNYSLEQTLNDHSASITAVKFTGESPEVRMVSCGADKSIYFQTAEQTSDGPSFSRSHHVVEKTTLYDMDLDSSRTHAAIACQDRNVRVYNVETGKLKKVLKGSSSDEGALLKVHVDPSGSFFATSCSDKNIGVFDYESGECVSTLFGHSEIVTCMKFSHDGTHLITASGDSCVFMWRLDAQMTSTIRRRRSFRASAVAAAAAAALDPRSKNIRRETFITVPSGPLPHTEEEEDLRTPARLDPAQDPPLLQTNGKLPMWFRRLQGQGSASSCTIVQSDTEPRQVRSRWAGQLEPLVICSNFSPSQGEEGEEEQRQEEEEEEEEDEDFHPQSLESLLVEGEEQERSRRRSRRSRRREFGVQGVADPQASVTQPGVKGQGVEPVWSTQLSPDSACSEGSTGSLDQQHDADTDSLSQGSSVGSLCLEDDEDRNSLKNHFETLASSLSDEKFDTDPRTLQPPEEKHFLNPRLSISTRFLSRFQDRIRAWPSRAPPPASIPTRISEESANTVRPGPGPGLHLVLVHTWSWSTPDPVFVFQVNSSGEATLSESTPKEAAGEVLRRRASCLISHQPQRRPRRRRHTVVVVQCRDAQRGLYAAASRSLGSSVQQGASRLGYLGTTASSRAKLTQEPEENPAPAGPDHRSRPDPRQDQTSSGAASPQLATPTDVTSHGEGRGWSLSSTEATPTNQNQTLVQSPAPSHAPTVTPASTCDLISSSAPKEEGGAAPGSRKQTDPGDDDDEDDDEESVSLLQCQQVADELRETARRAADLYHQLQAAADGSRRCLVLREAFDVVTSELLPLTGGGGRSGGAPGGRSGGGAPGGRSGGAPGGRSGGGGAPGGRSGGGGAPGGRLEDDGTLSLLEKYSERLLQMTQNKLKRV
ncbi:uncharacterized protein V6R79_021037 [Siganus canaliculatus]